MNDDDRHPIEATLHALADTARKGCACEKYRKPCEYHDGMADGVDLALAAVRTSPMADVSDWLAGA